MSNQYKSRQEKISLLTDILKGKKGAADIERNGRIDIVVWSQDETGNWQDDKGVRTMTKEEVQTAFSGPQTSYEPHELHVFVVAPNSEDED